MRRPIYVDTNVFVKAFESTGASSDHAWHILDAVTDGRIRAVTSELTLAELLPKPLELGSKLLVDLYSGLIKTEGNLLVVPVSKMILIGSAHLRAVHAPTRLPDAIHIATALESGCIAMVSDDLRLRTPQSLHLVRLVADTLQQIEMLAS